MSDRMTVEEWRVRNEGELHSIQLRYALWDWQNDRVELKQQVADLVAALEDVEWVRDFQHKSFYCPWCLSVKPHHFEECKRQQALAAVAGESE